VGVPGHKAGQPAKHTSTKHRVSSFYLSPQRQTHSVLSSLLKPQQPTSHSLHKQTSKCRQGMWQEWDSRAYAIALPNATRLQDSENFKRSGGSGPFENSRGRSAVQKFNTHDRVQPFLFLFRPSQIFASHLLSKFCRAPCCGLRSFNQAYPRLWPRARVARGSSDKRAGGRFRALRRTKMLLKPVCS
jgi:hypothetical protein